METCKDNYNRTKMAMDTDYNDIAQMILRFHDYLVGIQFPEEMISESELILESSNHVRVVMRKYAANSSMKHPLSSSCIYLKIYLTTKNIDSGLTVCIFQKVSTHLLENGHCCLYTATFLFSYNSFCIA